MGTTDEPSNGSLERIFKQMLSAASNLETHTIVDCLVPYLWRQLQA